MSMSRKSRRNVSKNAAQAERSLALRLPYSTLGLSSLALGSMAIAGAVHAQDAAASSGKSTDGVKPKATPSAAQVKSLRSKLTRLASSGALPTDGAGLLAQNSAAPAAATAQNVPEPTSSSASQLQEIVVTGIRGSLQRSMQIKRMSMGVVDAISAEDIGQFPDSSIGQAVARIPGVTVNRGSLFQGKASGAPTANGLVQGVTVRGFGGSFNEILQNGRQIASGDGQTFNFNDFSAIYVGQVDVHKTPDFSLSSGDIAATINVKFPNPFDNPGPHAQAQVSENVNSLDGGWRPQVGALFSDTFDDGKFGILIDGDYLDSHILAHHQDVVGWKGKGGSPATGYFPCSDFATAPPSGPFGSSGCASVGPGATGNSKVPSWYPQDMAMYLERTDARRKDGRASLQWRPMDTVLVTLDDNFSSDDEHIDRWQRSTWFNSFGDITQDANGTITNFVANGGEAPTDFNAFIADDYIVTNTYGMNVLWDINDQWTGEIDADQSLSQYNPNGTYTDIDADTGFGDNLNQYAGGLVTSENSNVLPYWSAYGPGAAAPGQAAPPVSAGVTPANYNGLNPFIIGSHVFPLQTQKNSDRINEAKVDATWHAGSTKVNFGAQFIDDSWQTIQWDTFTNNYWQLWSGYGPASGNAAGVALPSSIFTSINLGTWMPGYSGAGNLPSSLVLYSPYAVLNYLVTQPINTGFAPSNGAPVPKYPGVSNYPNTNTTSSYPAQQLSTGADQSVIRKTYSPFVTAEHNFALGDMTLKADAGVRYVKVDERISGLSAPLVSVAWNGIGDPSAYSFTVSPTPVWTTVDSSYHYVLPSLDLNLLVTQDIKVRLDYSRTLDAPPNGQLIPNTSYGGRVNALTATGNNPDLLPFLADNYDLGVEWYYASNDYVSVDGFMKKVKNFPTSTVAPLATTISDPAPCTNPVTGAPLSSTCGQPMVFSETTYTNAESATVRGVEATWQQMLLWGFGFQLNGTYVHTDKNFDPYSLTSNQFALPGVGNSANLIAFYQRHGLQARLAVQWQGTELLTLGQEQSGGAFGAEPVYLKSNTELDFSTQYDINSHFNAYFEALNLTDTIYHTYGRFSNQTLNLVEYGRTYTIGVRAKF
jgi:iron complex outermembrane recepter protein